MSACAEMLVDQLRQGVSYRQLMAALFLAGIRNVNPRPPGFALHCVFVIHSAHIISLEAPADSRLLPLFYALDNFKSAQERDARQPSGDYTMRPIAGPFPAPERAAAEFTASMEAWDPERAERAAVSLARHRSASQVFEMLWRYGARDYRNIGHKAIFVANAHRTLNAIGWQHAEPVLRSLVLAPARLWKTTKRERVCLRRSMLWRQPQTLKGNSAHVWTTSWMAEQADPTDHAQPSRRHSSHRPRKRLAVKLPLASPKAKRMLEQYGMRSTWQPRRSECAPAPALRSWASTR